MAGVLPLERDRELDEDTLDEIALLLEERVVPLDGFELELEEREDLDELDELEPLDDRDRPESRSRAKYRSASSILLSTPSRFRSDSSGAGLPHRAFLTSSGSRTPFLFLS